uniref:Uncharacterized protein n=1 Tax=Chromera velia CCMP2878 TaxID=1169474 RepID=A0A0G4HAM7_9ALVE|mmetsp:Transcript_49809/g.98177  ORF Transcript_49809/g.98177 Transcript_49809/m.98177 type:complete len:184 (-) Transcript_49809:217-768(-)|eukprot:Cvel_25570.t1-p1 / transcript=Cvel_25570.t1 / gene=Cvel_25570 / organism=Chromera_velia_CCMP2878 / gene_product=hypothetical protein / transcript_product=hypothetical protein / location=Cvel_scaffold2915:19588-20136(+) / protein_length=183 / sequence_SO=supercontig / SO=protein_coding / is_pseudo=false
MTTESTIKPDHIRPRDATYRPASNRYLSTPFEAGTEIHAVAAQTIKRPLSYKPIRQTGVNPQVTFEKNGGPAPEGKILSAIVGYKGHCPARIPENVVGHTFTETKRLGYGQREEERTLRATAAASGGVLPSSSQATVVYPKLLKGSQWFQHVKEAATPFDPSIQPALRSAWLEGTDDTAGERF